MPLARPRQVLDPDTQQWNSFPLPYTLSQSTIEVTANAGMMGFLNNGTRLLVCGGANVLNELTNTCYYMEKQGDDLVVGGAPELDRLARGGCQASDGNSLAFAGGKSRLADGSNTYETTTRVLLPNETEWRDMVGTELHASLSAISSVRVGDHMWCIGGYDGVSGGWRWGAVLCCAVLWWPGPSRRCQPHSYRAE